MSQVPGEGLHLSKEAESQAQKIGVAWDRHAEAFVYAKTSFVAPGLFSGGTDGVSIFFNHEEPGVVQAVHIDGYQDEEDTALVTSLFGEVDLSIPVDDDFTTSPGMHQFQLESDREFTIDPVVAQSLWENTRSSLDQDSTQ